MFGDIITPHSLVLTLSNRRHFGYLERRKVKGVGDNERSIEGTKGKTVQREGGKELEKRGVTLLYTVLDSNSNTSLPLAEFV